MAHRPIHYLADHERSGKALFSRREDARTWLEEQTAYHHDGQATKWADGGHHGWQALRLGDGTTTGTVSELKLDGVLPDYDDEPGWD
jgi:hypothetical protein